MSEVEEIEQNSPNDSEKDELIENEVKPEKVEKSYAKRSDKTKAELRKESKQRAIDNFTRGIPDPEYRVVKLNSGKFRCYPRKQPLPPEPIKLNQVPENKRSSELETRNDDEIEAKPRKPKIKGEHDPFSDIVYYNLSNQISEQLNKRLDAVNVELERLRHKNSKLKGKYKQLKQAIYITEEEDNNENESKPIVEQQVNQHEPQPQPQKQFESPIIRPTRRTTAINFNRFFN